MKRELSTVTGSNPIAATKLTAEQSVEVAGRIATVAERNLPLAPALRALAEEIPSRLVSKSLVQLAGALEQGEPLHTAVGTAGIPPHLAGILLAGVQSGSLAAALMQYAEHRRTLSVLRHQVVLSTVYPAIVMVGVVFVVLGAAFIVGRTAREFLDNFGVVVPLQTRMLVGVADHSLYLGLGIVASGATYLLLGRKLWRGAWKQLPLLGPVWRWTAQAEFCQLMALLVERGLPLHTALRLTADGLADEDLTKATARLAVAAEQGLPLGAAIAGEREFAPTLAPWLGWAQHVGALDDGLTTAAEMFRARVRAQVGLLKIVLPPIMLVFVGWGVGFVGAALFAPMIELITSLSM